MKTVVMPIIELDNNYYLQILDNIKKFTNRCYRYTKLKTKKYKKK